MKKYDDWYKEPVIGDVVLDTLYFNNHSTRPAVKKVIEMVNGFRCNSILDVGCRSMGFLSKIKNRYKVKIATDIYNPAFTGLDNTVQFICADYLKYTFTPVDVIVCMETLEHIRPDLKREFAQKLLSDFQKHLIVSIPYMWEGCTEPVPHNGYNESHIMEWFWPFKPDEVFIIQKHLLAHFSKGIIDESNS